MLLETFLFQQVLPRGLTTPQVLFLRPWHPAYSNYVEFSICPIHAGTGQKERKENGICGGQGQVPMPGRKPGSSGSEALPCLDAAIFRRL